MHKTYKYRLYPNNIQKELLEKTFGCVRFVWNKNVECFKNKEKFLTTKEYRNKFEFLKEVSAAALQQKEIDFKRLLKEIFKSDRKSKIGFPQFKSKKQKQSYRLPNQKIKLSHNKIYLEKIGWIKLIKDREIEGRILSATISKDTCNDYFVSILVEQKIKKFEKTNKSIGLDVGIKNFLTTSDGTQFKMFSDNQRKQKKLQRILSKKKKNSRRYNKIRLKLAKLYRKITQKRNWILHNISTKLVKDYDQIVIEDLNVAGMLKNHKLANSIQKQSWSSFFNMLKYKCEWYGKQLIKINKWFPSSKTCSKCGTIKENLSLAERIFKCENCGFEIDRDLNAAINILTVGVNAV